MRLICTLQNPAQGKIFSDFLTFQGIENQLDIKTENDWGSDDYGTPTVRVWVYDEDQVADAQKWFAAFEKKPEDLQFQQTLNENPKPSSESFEKINIKEQRRGEQPLTQGVGRVSLYFIILCTLLLFYGNSTAPSITKLPSSLPATPLLSPPINKTLFYDYPKAYDILDKIARVYGLEKLQAPTELPMEGQILFQQFKETPYWHGFYQKLVNHLKYDEPLWKFTVPMFEKIRQGEIWRLFTPVVLHADFFHLIFNMIWLLVIGKQMEQKMGSSRYLLFILLTGIFSNTAQYLMGGPNFLGFSGVLCAMIAFVWVRQRHAAWEDYQIVPSTFLFIALFITILFLTQFSAFFLEVYSDVNFSPGMANTAHLSGAFIGWLLGHLNFFSRKY